MRRRVELERAQYLASTVARRNEEVQTRHWCKIDEISRDKVSTERVRQRLAAEERERERQDEQHQRQARAQRDLAERARAAQLIEERRQEICDKKLRQRLREESEELRLLEQQLRTAYVAKVRESGALIYLPCHLIPFRSRRKTPSKSNRRRRNSCRKKYVNKQFPG